MLLISAIAQLYAQAVVYGEDSTDALVAAGVSSLLFVVLVGFEAYRSRGKQRVALLVVWIVGYIGIALSLLTLRSFVAVRGEAWSAYRQSRGLSLDDGFREVLLCGIDVGMDESAIVSRMALSGATELSKPIVAGFRHTKYGRPQDPDPDSRVFLCRYGPLWFNPKEREYVHLLQEEFWISFDDAGLVSSVRCRLLWQGRSGTYMILPPKTVVFNETGARAEFD